MQIQIEQVGDETRISSQDPTIKEMQVILHGEGRKMLVVSEHGFGKRTPVDEYRCQKRGGSGMATMNCTNKTGQVAGALIVSDDQDVVILTHLGQIIRTPVSKISVSGRKTQGVKLINLDKGDFVKSVTAVPREDI